MKNRADTEKRLIKAVGEILAESGFGRLGVNAVARQAGVDKVLIYRYFSGLDGLIKAYANSDQFWPSTGEILGEGERYDALMKRPFGDIMAEVFRRYAMAIRSRPLTLEILAWETIERNALTVELEQVREAMGLELMGLLTQTETPPGDWQAVSVIFTGAIHYLAIRGRKIRFFSGMDLSSDREWVRLIDTMAGLVSSTVNIALDSNKD